MTGAFDYVGGLRLVRVGIQIDGEFIYFTDLDMRIQGQKWAGPTWGSCTIKISNLTVDQQNKIMTTATPFIKTGRPINVTVDVGREKSGYFSLFQGQCFSSNITQPPDIGITLRSVTQNFQASLMQVVSQNSSSTLKSIAQTIATKNGWKLDATRVTDRQIANFGFIGSGQKLLNKLSDFGAVRVYLDDATQTLVLTDPDKARQGAIFQLSQQTGMVGVPQATQNGCIVQCLVQPEINIGQGISVFSAVNKSVNSSNYYISQIAYDIANRDNPFYYTITCTDLSFPPGTTT